MSDLIYCTHLEKKPTIDSAWVRKNQRLDRSMVKPNNTRRKNDDVDDDDVIIPNVILLYS